MRPASCDSAFSARLHSIAKPSAVNAGRAPLRSGVARLDRRRNAIKTLGGISMSAVNPYMPPRAQVADVLDPASEYQPVKIFSWRGRIGRLRYLAYSALGYFAMFVAAMVLGIVAAVSAQPAFVALIPLLVTVPYFAFLVMLSVQRSHDMGWSGWSTLLLIVP